MLQAACRTPLADAALVLGVSTEGCLRDGRLADLATAGGGPAGPFIQSPYAALLDEKGEPLAEDSEPGLPTARGNSGWAAYRPSWTASSFRRCPS
jgi:hypothetical protein